MNVWGTSIKMCNDARIYMISLRCKSSFGGVDETHHFILPPPARVVKQTGRLSLKARVSHPLPLQDDVENKSFYVRYLWRQGRGRGFILRDDYRRRGEAEEGAARHIPFVRLVSHDGRAHIVWTRPHHAHGEMTSIMCSMSRYAASAAAPNPFSFIHLDLDEKS